MPDNAAIEPLWPHWTQTIGAMLGIRALVRSRCCVCGTELRVDTATLVARYGPSMTLIDTLERCPIVGCAGSIYFLAARSYDRPWTVLIRNPWLLQTIAAPTEQTPCNE
jgi:hypothetical protein